MSDKHSQRTSMSSNFTRRRLLKVAGASGTMFGFAGCTQNGGSDSGDGSNGSGGGASGSNSGGSEIPDVDIDAIRPDELVGEGPMGNDPVRPEAVELSENEKSQLADGDYTVAIVFHYLRTAWYRLQRRGLEDQFEELEINVEGVYGAELDAQQQVSVLETLASKSDEIDAVISIPVDQTVTADAYMNLFDEGVDITFIDNVAEGFDHPDNYNGVVAADNRGNGLIAGRVLAEKIGGEGKVGLIEHDAQMYVNDEREIGAKKALKEYPDVEVVAKNGFVDDPGSSYIMTQNMLTAHPDLDGIFAIWGNPPAAESAAAAQEADRNDLVITCSDLGNRVADIMADNGPIRGIGSQRPYDQGVSEANMTALGLIGKDTPSYVAYSAMPVVRKNLLDAYETVFKNEPSEEITEHFN